MCRGNAAFYTALRLLDRYHLILLLLTRNVISVLTERHYIEKPRYRIMFNRAISIFVPIVNLLYFQCYLFVFDETFSIVVYH